MPSQGPLFAGAGIDDATVGTVAWTTPENVTADDTTRATRSLSQNITSHYLKSSAHGFSIPAGATIDGIVVEVDRSQSGTSPVRDNQIRLVKADGTFGATNKADTVNNWPTTPDVTVSYGSSSDLWGETWTPADINDPDFGVGVAARNSGATASTARVDFVRVTVYYTTAATPVDGSAGTLVWDLRSQADAAARVLPWDLAAERASSASLVWDLRAERASLVFLLWDLSGGPGAVNGPVSRLVWDLRAQASSSRSLRWDLAAARASSLAIPWDLRSQADGPLKRLVWDLLAPSGVVTAFPLDLRWRLWSASYRGGVIPATFADKVGSSFEVHDGATYGD